MKTEKEHDDYQAVTILLKGQEWEHFVKYLKIQAMSFQKQVNQHVEDGDIERAKIAKALMNDRVKLIQGFIKQHNEQGE